MTQVEIKALASEIIGDGQLPNKFFVTTSPWYREVDEYGDVDTKLLEGGYDDSYTYTEMFDTYEEANDRFEKLELDIYDGTACVSIEDRLTGLIKEKCLEKVIKVDYVQTMDNHMAKMFGYEK
jgi:hypothetical protein